VSWLLRLIPAPYRWLALAALAAAAWGAWAWHGHTEFQRGVQSQKDRQAVIDAERTRLALAESEKRRAQEAQVRKAQQEAINEAESRAAQARADRVIAEAASGALQRRYEQRVRDLVRAVTAAATARGAGAADPAAASAGTAAEDPAGVLADVFGRCVERVRVLAAIADERGAAGAACQRAYEALTPAAASPGG
jgi:hypothetical protein